MSKLINKLINKSINLQNILAIRSPNSIITYVYSKYISNLVLAWDH